MSYKLVALDLDGTLLSNDKTIAGSTVELIQQAKRNGVRFTIATGRMSRGALRYAQELEIDIPIITYNGAMTRSPISEDIYHECKVPAERAIDAINLLRDEPVLRYVFLNDDVYTDTPHEWTDRYADLLGVTMNFVDDTRELLIDDPTMLVFMVTELRARELTMLLKSELESQVKITNSADWFLDVLPVRSSKGSALAKLAGSLGIKREEVIAIGDNLNDLEMIEYAGLGVAVANAAEELKSAANYITTLPINEGVEEVLQKYVFSAQDYSGPLYVPDTSS